MDGGVTTDNYGNLFMANNSWGTTSGDFGNWNIRGYVDVGGPAAVLDNRNIPDHTGYKVERKTSSTGSFTTIATLPQTQTTYIDANPVVNTINHYAVTALYGSLEASLSNQQSLFVPSPTLVHYVYDNGIPTTSQTYNGSRVNKFSPTIHPAHNRYKVVAIDFYVQMMSSWALDLEIFNEVDGYPGELIHTMNIPASLFEQGWNTIILDDVAELEITQGSFFAGFRTVANSARIGISNNTSGMTYVRAGAQTQYTILTTGVLMVRAWVDRFTGNGDIYDTPLAISAVNYPNPFNPETTISFNMPVKGHVSLQVYNIRGQLVDTLLNHEVASGRNEVTWKGIDAKGNSVSSGIYFYKIKTDEQTIVNKMLLMK